MNYTNTNYFYLLPHHNNKQNGCRIGSGSYQVTTSPLNENVTNDHIYWNYLLWN